MVQHAGFEGFQIERGMLDRLQTALTSAAAAESDKQQCASATAQMALEKNPLHRCTFNDALYGEISASASLTGQDKISCFKLEALPPFGKLSCNKSAEIDSWSGLCEG